MTTRLFVTWFFSSIIQLVVEMTGRRILVESQLVGSRVFWVSKEFLYLVEGRNGNRLPNSPQILGRIFFLF
jgi:hypothetical protein